MRYSKSDLMSLSYADWMETIAKELNQAGFQTKILKFSTAEPHWVNGPYEVHDPDTFFDTINSSKAINYLKEIGLLDNGRCPMCGDGISHPGRFTDGYNSSISYQICQRCVRTKGGLLPDSRGCGCLLFLLMLLMKLFL